MDPWRDRAGSTAGVTDLIGAIEPGRVDLRVGASSADIRQVLEFALVGSRRTVGVDRRLEPDVFIEPVAIH
jgi:hypothetical protein